MNAWQSAASEGLNYRRTGILFLTGKLVYFGHETVVAEFWGFTNLKWIGRCGMSFGLNGELAVKKTDLDPEGSPVERFGF